MELQKNYDQIKGAGLGLAAVSYDSVGVLENFTARHHIAYPLLSDPESKIIRDFGILNETATGLASGVPYPGVYILDANGVVKAKYFESDYKERDSTGLILLKQFGIAPETPHSTQQAKHLAVTTSASATAVHYGLKLALYAEIALEPKVHVYAPGIEGYIPISWSLADSPAWKAAGAVQFPASRNLRLEAIHETVPVFERTFRLTREIVIADDKAAKPLLDPAGNLNIEGTIRYQACDDRECYLPANVPVKWTFPFESLDRTRVPAELQRKTN